MFVKSHTQSPIAWLGGKSKLAATIVERLPEHTVYCEPFCGAAWVLFSKPPSEVEIINDINAELVTLFRCIQHHLVALVEQFKWMLVSRDEFDRFLATPPEALTDIQRAARFYYLNKTAFGSRMRNPTFALSVTRPARLNLLRIEEDLSAAHLRLHRVQIESRPWSQVIERVDRTDALFYIDPPYWGCEGYYGANQFTRDDFTALAAQLAGLKGRFILSLNDTPGVRQTFAAFHCEAVQTTYTINSTRSQRVGELLISNTKLTPRRPLREVPQR